MLNLIYVFVSNEASNLRLFRVTPTYKQSHNYLIIATTAQMFGVGGFVSNLDTMLDEETEYMAMKLRPCCW